MSRTRGDRGFQPHKDLFKRWGDMSCLIKNPFSKNLAIRKERRKINDELSRKPAILDDIEEASHHNFEEDDIQDSITFESREIMACNTQDQTGR